MPLVVMKIVGAKYGNKNVKMIFYMIWGGKMPLDSYEIYWGKIATTNLPLRPPTTIHDICFIYINHIVLFKILF